VLSLLQGNDETLKIFYIIFSKKFVGF
jgi:hypothetical protein